MIDPVQCLIALRRDLEAIEDIRRDNRWNIEPWPLESVTFLVTMASAIDREHYTIRLVCDGYPDQPPSIKCVNTTTKEPTDPSAWPRCAGFRPPPTADLCMNISREALQQIHPDWQRDARYAWVSSGNPMWHVLEALQDRLNDKAKYNGRNQ